MTSATVDTITDESLILPPLLSQIHPQHERISLVDPTLETRKRALAEARQRRKDRERERQRQLGDPFSTPTSTPTSSAAPERLPQPLPWFQQTEEVIDLTDSPVSAQVSTNNVIRDRNSPAAAALVDDEDDVVFVSSTAPLPLPRQIVPTTASHDAAHSYFGRDGGEPSTPIFDHTLPPPQPHQGQQLYPMLRNDFSVVQQILNGGLMIGHRFMPYLSVSPPTAHTSHQQAVRPPARMLPQPIIEPDPEPSDPARLKCALCQSVPDAKTALSSTICGHIFCEECLKTSLKNYGKKCPNCRKSLAGKNAVHRLYF